MGSYNIVVKRSAEKELRNIPKPYLAQITEKISLLSRQPRPYGIQLLKGESRYFRLRQGDYRIIYEVDDAKHIITVIKIGHRREVYH